MLRLARLIGGGYLVLSILALVASFFTGPLGYAPFPLPFGPSQQPVVLTVWYGTEKQEWLEDAVQRFEASNPRVGARPIQVQIAGSGSGDIVARVAQEDWRGSNPPAVISPASSLWLELLERDIQRSGSRVQMATGSDAPRPLVLTPLVLVAWEQRGQTLWRNSPASFWQDLHDALTNPQGWSALGQSGWGFVKFGHTSPLSSNSGAQTLLLLAYGYHNKTGGLTTADVLDPGFQQWFIDIERSVLEFGDSTGTLMTNMVQFGPSRYDLVAVYENLALENIDAARGRWGQNIHIYYPPATVLSDHPYAMLEAPWVTAEQRQAARQFRDFLLSRPAQELALQSGFRPADPQVPLDSDDPSNPFTRYQQYGVQTALGQQAEVPSGDVVDALLELWRSQIKR